MFSFNTKRGGGGERADYLVWEPDRGHRVLFTSILKSVYMSVGLSFCSVCMSHSPISAIVSSVSVLKITAEYAKE